jgi:hypothetical protein
MQCSTDRLISTVAVKLPPSFVARIDVATASAYTAGNGPTTRSALIRAAVTSHLYALEEETRNKRA